MKKNLYIILAVAGLTMSTLSCSDYLDEDNKVLATADLAYSTTSGIQGLVSSCYSFSRAWYGKEAGLGSSLKWAPTCLTTVTTTNKSH